MKTAYLDCTNGICGSMVVGAFLDAGLSLDLLRQELSRLEIDGLSISATKTSRRGLAGTLFRVQDSTGESPDALPDQSQLQVRPVERTKPSGMHGAGHHRHTHAHHHGHPHSHPHPHPGSEVGANPHHEHRNLRIILRLLEASSLPKSVIAECGRIFTRLAKAEAKVHGVGMDEIHFHEVGALDAIADIICAVSAKHLMGIEKVLASPVAVGGGTVRCAHGVLPVPAPATAELLKGIPLANRDVSMEMTTPTGAAILAEWADSFGNLGGMSIEAIGYGAGEKDPPHPNLLRVVIGNAASDTGHFLTDKVIQIETHLDDTTAEDAADAIDRLLEAGALDAGFSPLAMKKGRPGLALVVLCEPSKFDAVSLAIFQHTTAIGLRHIVADRRKLRREDVVVETSYGSVPGKEVLRQPGQKSFKPDHDACSRLAVEHGVSSRIIRQAGEIAWLAKQEPNRG